MCQVYNAKTYWSHHARKNGWMQKPSTVITPTAVRKIEPNTANTMSPASRPKLVGSGLKAKLLRLRKASSIVVGPACDRQGHT